MIHLFPPVIESQFIYQIGKVVSLPVEKFDGCWRLRHDKRALQQMKKAGIYDPALLPNMFGPKSWRKPLTGWEHPMHSARGYVPMFPGWSSK